MYHFPIGILGQVWYLIVSIPDLCTLTYFEKHQTMEFLLMVDFLHIFKNVAFFKIFRDFLNLPVAPGKVVNALYFI